MRKYSHAQKHLQAEHEEGKEHKAEVKLRTAHHVLPILGFMAPFFFAVIFFGALVGYSVQGAQENQDATRLAERSTSDLEVGVTDLSPRGASGGAYIPASCELGLSHRGSCNVTVSAGPSQTIYVGQTAQAVSYSSSQADNCTYRGSGALSAGNFTAQGATSGTIRPGAFNTTGTWTLDFTCSDLPVTRTFGATVYIIVIPRPPTVDSLSFNPSTIASGGSSNIAFSSSYATACEGQGILVGNLGFIAAGGVPTGPQLFDIVQSVRCSGPGGTSAWSSATLTVTPPPVIGTCPTPNGVGPANSCPTGFLGINNIQGNGHYHWYCDGAPNVESNGSGLCWYVPPAASCTGTSYWGNCGYDVSGLASGASVVSTNSLFGYTGSATISCTNGTQTLTSPTCNAVAGPPPPTVDSLSFGPSTITSGASSMISFTSSNATACEGTGIFNGNLLRTSMTAVNTGVQFSTIVQQVRCSGPGGTSAWRSATLTVGSAPPASCFLPWGGSIADGAFVTAYASASANPCLNETRTCNDGLLSGTYLAQSCTPPVSGTQCTYYALPQSAQPTGPAACARGTYSAWTGGVSPLYWFWNCVDGTETLSCGVLRDTRNCPITTMTWGTPAMCTGNTSLIATHGSAVTALDNNSLAIAGSYVGGATYSCVSGTLNYSSGSCQQVLCTEPNDASGPYAACTFTCANGGTPYPACPLPFLPDLTAGGVTPLTATMNVPVVLSALVMNPGNGTNAPTPAGFNNFFQLNGVTNIGVTSTPILLGGASRRLGITHTFPTAGNYTVRLCVDKSSASDLGLISEGLGENNNCGPATPIEVFNPANTASFTAPPTCTIGTNSNTCFFNSPPVSWTSANITNVNLFQGGVLLTTTGGGPQSYPLAYLYHGSIVFELRRSDGFVLDITTGTASCGVNDTWNGSICEPPPPTGSFTTTPSCIIPVNGSSCTASVSWTSTGGFVSLTDSPSFPTGIYTSTGSGAQTYSPITIPHGGGTYYLFSNAPPSIPLDTVVGAATCAGGSSWNSFMCAPITSGAWFTSTPSCTIPLNGSGCTASVSWDSVGVSNGVRLEDGSGGIYTGPTYGAQSSSITIPYGGGTYRLRSLDDFSISDTINGTATCAAGLTWNATRCVVPTPVLTTTPTSLSFGAVLLGNAGTRTFTITNTGDPTSQLTGVVSGNALFVCTLGCTYTALTPASPPHTVTITFTPTALGLVSTPILFNGAPAPTPLVATGNGTPVTISVPAAINFSGVPAITPFTRFKDISFTITNIGSVNLPNDTFTGYAAPYTCVSVATCGAGGINLTRNVVNTVTLRFRPTAPITYPQQIGTLTGQPAYSITIDGRGILPVFNVKEQ